MDRSIGLCFEAIYKDDHLLEVRISVWNGAFGGVTEAYVGLD